MARELDLDWKTIDHHLRMLACREFVREGASYGKIKIYCLAQNGRWLVHLIDNFKDDLEAPSRSGCLPTSSKESEEN